LGFCLLLAAGGASSAPDLQSLLPTEEEVVAWKLVDQPLVYDAGTLFNFINGGAEVYLEYGFVEVVSQEYGAGEDSVIATIYEMEDPTAAFGVFSYNRSPQKTLLDLGDGGFQGGFQVAFLQDRYFVLVESYSSGSTVEEAQVAFSEVISKKIGTRANQPAVVSELPSSNLVAGSPKLLKGRLAVRSLFFLAEGDVFDLGDKDIVLYGEYDGSGGKAKLYLVIYESSQKAERTGARLKQAFDGNEDYTRLRSQDSIWSEETRFLGLALSGAAVAVVAEAESQRAVEQLLKATSGR
jgi:hypothetical protein